MFKRSAIVKSQTEVENREDLTHVKEILKREPSDSHDVELDSCSTSELEPTDEQLPSQETFFFKSAEPIDVKLESRARTRTTEHFTETYDENSTGLSWGEKKALDDTWREKWLQQTLKSKKPAEKTGTIEDANIIFGRSCGQNDQLHERWVSSWRHEDSQETGLQKRIKKIVQRHAEGDSNHCVEEWREQIFEDANKSKIVKAGYDHVEQRVWTDVCETVTASDEQTKASELLKQTCQEAFPKSGVLKVYSRTTEKKDACEITEETSYAPEEVKRLMQELQLESVIGTQIETKNTAPDHNEVIKHRIWKKSKGGDDAQVKEVVEDKIFGDGTTQKKTIETLEDGTVVTTLHQREFYFGTEKVKTIKQEKHWKKTNNDAWGNNESSKFDESQRLIEEQGETWHDNTTEKFSDRWTTTREYDGELASITMSGYKRGNKYVDGTEWGERWGRQYTKDPAGSTTVSTSEKPDEVPQFVENLKLSSRQEDKWWKESTGNQWGEKVNFDYSLNTEKHEKWYDNGEEVQVDRWEIDSTQSRAGEKFGHKGSCEWKEKWLTSSQNEDFSIEKSWAETRDGANSQWGEKEGREGVKQWRESWKETKACDSDSGSKWANKWVDDGQGNFSTCKEGVEWREGNTTNWYLDQYGECLGASEKWAYKKGANEHGDSWMEKWNEKPAEKFAEKSGSNAQGDEWREIWKETSANETVTKWAEKTGKNHRGEEWFESWWEDQVHKYAKKKGQNPSEEWQEEWGEEENPDGSGEKWTSKWSVDRHSGHRHGQNWGDRWGSNGQQGHHWSEEWINDQRYSNSYDTPGRPAGC